MPTALQSSPAAAIVFDRNSRPGCAELHWMAASESLVAALTDRLDVDDRQMLVRLVAGHEVDLWAAGEPGRRLDLGERLAEIGREWLAETFAS